MLKGALPLFRVAGIQVYLHFTWFIVAVLEFSQFSRRYQSPIWGIFEYLSLFAIVLLHEFGHSFACRQVGGKADQIMLWPLGGAAFVSPPQRPGAYLWSIAAGPLVNVILFPILTLVRSAAASALSEGGNPDIYLFISGLWYMNLLLLAFNILPFYPLDGGQIVRGLLWYWLGRTRSLRVASVLGMIGAIGLGILAFYARSWWIGILAFFIFSQAQMGWRQARALQLEEENAKRVEPIPATADPRVSVVKPPPLP
jgi:Zn-dependent protease